MIHGTVTQSKPREFSFPVVVGLQNGAAPPLHTLFQLYSHLRMRYTEEGRMTVEGTFRHRTQAQQPRAAPWNLTLPAHIQAGIWLGAQAEDAAVEVVQGGENEGPEAESEDEADVEEEEGAQQQDFAPVAADDDQGQGVEMDAFEGRRTPSAAAEEEAPGAPTGAPQAAARKAHIPDVD